MRAVVLALVALLPSAYAADRCRGMVHPCVPLNVVSEPLGALVTVSDEWGEQSCSAPCSLQLRSGQAMKVVAHMDGYNIVMPFEGPRWAWKAKVFGRSRNEIEPDPVTYRFEKAKP